MVLQAGGKLATWLPTVCCPGSGGWGSLNPVPVFELASPQLFAGILVHVPLAYNRHTGDNAFECWMPAMWLIKQFIPDGNR